MSMVFDALLPDNEVKTDYKYLKPDRANLRALLRQKRKEDLVTIIIYSIQISFAYLFLIKYYGIHQVINQLALIQLYSIFIGIAAFIDQLFNPDENSKFGYYMLLMIYYVIYKFVIFGGSLYLILQIMGIEVELHYFEETLIIMTVFISWAIGQKLGYYFQHRRILKKGNTIGFENLDDIDKLKIFLYQLHRRSFLKMLIQNGKAKFHDLYGIDKEQIPVEAKLVSLNLSKFMKYLKLTDLPEYQYVSFDRIKAVNLSKNKIKNFSTYIFKIFPNAEIIDISHNKIKTISDKAQEEIMMLKSSVEINLDGNPVFSF